MDETAPSVVVVGASAGGVKALMTLVEVARGRFSVALIKYICDSASPRRPEMRSRRFNSPPSTNIETSVISAKAVDSRPMAR